MNMKISATALILVVTYCVCLGEGVNTVQKTYTSGSTGNQAVVIDGILDDAAWQNIPWGDSFTQRSPNDGKSPTQKTSFKILYDENFLYVAIKAWDNSPDSIVKRVSRRDNADGDLVGISIDSYHDRRTAFSFWVNAAGVKNDFNVTNDGDNEDSNWDPIWWVKTSIDKQGWNAEIKIPLNQLRFSSSDTMKWGLQVGRYLFRKEESTYWQYIPRQTSGWVSFYGGLDGLSNLKPRRQVEVAPYVVAKTERFKRETGNPFMTGRSNNLNVGVDAKVGLTNDFTLDLTVNPDFGQVEADPAVVNLTAFETYYSEKRPFFIEGSNLLSFNLTGGDGDDSYENLFYSRRIGRTPQVSPDLDDDEYIDFPENTTILGAAKITGHNRNGLSVGVLESLTAKTYAEIDSAGKRSNTIVEPLTNYFVTSIRKDYNEGNTIIGGIITSTNRQLTPSTEAYLHRNAYSGGLDFQHQWAKKKYYFNAKAYFSRVEGTKEAILATQESSSRYFQRPDAKHVSIDSSRTSLTGSGGLVQFGKVGEGHIRYLTFVSWKSPELEVNDIGYSDNVDDIFQVIWVGYRYLEPISIFRSININLNQWTGWNFGGDNSYKGGNVNANFQFRNYYYLSFGANRDGNSLSNSALRGGPMLKTPGYWNIWYDITSDQRKAITFDLGGYEVWGDESSRLTHGVYASVAYKPSKKILIKLYPEYSYSQKVLQYVGNYEWETESLTRYVNASLYQNSFELSLKLEYSINPDLTIQYYGRTLLVSGKYDHYKFITNPLAHKFENRFKEYTLPQLTYVEDDNIYNVDENLDGTTDYSFDKKDFNFMDFQSNMIIRWEYRPGSTLFLVWTQGRNDYLTNYSTSTNHDINNLFDQYPQNIFLVKFSYRFN